MKELPKNKAWLCVGGPRSGERYHILHGSGFSAPVRPTRSAADDPDHEDYRPNKRPMIEFTNYREEIFHTPQGDVAFWVPEGQTPLQTITLLLETYEQAHQIANVSGAVTGAPNAIPKADDE